MAMAVQKSCLAIMDKERDPDMVKRIRLYNIEYINNMVTAMLEQILRILMALVRSKSSSSGSSKD